MRLELLGGFEATDAAGEPIALSSKKAAALLAFVALRRGRPASRDKLAGLLWRESADAQARISLRQALSVLRRSVPPGVLVTDAQSVSVDPRAIDVDVTELERLLDDGSPDAVTRAAELYRGDLLDGFYARAPELENWLLVERTRLRERVNAALVALLEREREPRRAIRLAVRALALDPLQEGVHRQLIELYARTGRRGAAIRQYRICRDALERELGILPADETTRMIEAMGERETDREEPRVSRPAPAAVTQPEPELRQVTVLMAGLADDDASAEVRVQMARRQSDAVGDCVEARGGRVLRRMGEAVMAVFGLERAGRLDPLRAVEAAADVHRRMRADEIGVQIGIADGQLMVARHGGELAAVGRAISAAAALHVRAPRGETLVSPSVGQSAADRVECVPAPQQAGMPEALRVIAVRGGGAGVQPFVGRHVELGQLRAILAGVCDGGRGHAVVIRGEAGLGKSRLLEQVQIEAQGLGFALHGASVMDFGVRRGRDAVATLARSLLGLPEDASPRRGLEAARDAGVLSADVREDALVFACELLDLEPPDELRAVYDAMDGERRLGGAQQALGELIRAAAARGPVLAWIEDIHWASERTLAHLHAALEAIEGLPVLLVMTTRIEGEPEPPWRSVTPRSAFTTIDLTPLGAEDAGALADWYGVDRDHAERCIARADGNPLFLDQLLRARCGAVPGTIHSLVRAQLDALSAAERRAVKAASVLGQRFELQELQRLVDHQGFEPESLIRRALVRPEAGAYRFAHSLVCSAVYESLMEGERRSLHRQAARMAGRSDAELRAEHLDRAEAPEAAAAYLRAARVRAAELHRRRALQLANRGLALEPEADLAFELAVLRADLLRDLGKVTESLAAFHTLLEGARGDAEVAVAAFGVAAGHRQADRDCDAMEALERAERAAERTGMRAFVGQICHLRGNLKFLRGERELCRRDQEHALAIAREVGSARDEADALSGLGDAEYARGNMVAAFAHFDRCVELAREHGFGRVEMANLHMRGLTRAYRLDVRGGLRDCLDVVDKAALMGNERVRVVAQTVLGTMRLLRGEWSDLQKDQARGSQWADALGARRFAALSRSLEGFALDRLDRHEQALEVLRGAVEDTRRAGAELAFGMVFGALAAVTGDAAERDGAIAEAEALMAADAISHNHLVFRPLAMLAFWRAGDAREIERHADALAAWAGELELAYVDYFVRWGRALADAARRRSDRRELEQLRERALDAELGLPLAPLQQALSQPAS